MKPFTALVSGVAEATPGALLRLDAYDEVMLPIPVQQRGADQVYRTVGRVLAFERPDGADAPVRAVGELYDDSITDAQRCAPVLASYTLTAAAGQPLALSDASIAAVVLVAAVTVDTSLPIAEDDPSWDGPAAEARMLDAATDDNGDVDPDTLGKGYLYQVPDTDGTASAHYKLPVADVIDGTLTIVPAGVSAASGAVNGARGGVKGISPADMSSINAALKKLTDKIDGADSSSDDSGDDDGGGYGGGGSGGPMTAAAGTRRRSRYTRPLNPPGDWYTNPGLDAPTPLTVLASGEVYGHVATWESCHRSFAASGVCMPPPRSRCDYCQYRLGTVVTADGSRVSAGALTVGGGHAELNLNAAAATAHYADVGSVAAMVAAGDDAHGIWVHGGLHPEVSDEQVYNLLSCPPSGDWREARPGGGLELLAVTAVAVPGYPTMQAHVAAGNVTALIVPCPVTAAANTPTHNADGSTELGRMLDEVKTLALMGIDDMAAKLGLDRRSRVAALDAQVHPRQR